MPTGDLFYDPGRLSLEENKHSHVAKEELSDGSTPTSFWILGLVIFKKALFKSILSTCLDDQEDLFCVT